MTIQELVEYILRNRGNINPTTLKTAIRNAAEQYGPTPPGPGPGPGPEPPTPGGLHKIVIGETLNTIEIDTSMSKADVAAILANYPEDTVLAYVSVQGEEFLAISVGHNGTTVYLDCLDTIWSSDEENGWTSFASYFPYNLGMDFIISQMDGNSDLWNGILVGAYAAAEVIPHFDTDRLGYFDFSEYHGVNKFTINRIPNGFFYDSDGNEVTANHGIDLYTYQGEDRGDYHFNLEFIPKDVVESVWVKEGVDMWLEEIWMVIPGASNIILTSDPDSGGTIEVVEDPTKVCFYCFDKITEIYSGKVRNQEMIRVEGDGHSYGSQYTSLYLDEEAHFSLQAFDERLYNDESEYMYFDDGSYIHNETTDALTPEEQAQVKHMTHHKRATFYDEYTKNTYLLYDTRNFSEFDIPKYYNFITPKTCSNSGNFNLISFGYNQPYVSIIDSNGQTLQNGQWVDCGTNITVTVREIPENSYCLGIAMGTSFGGFDGLYYDNTDRQITYPYTTVTVGPATSELKIYFAPTSVTVNFDNTNISSPITLGIDEARTVVVECDNNYYLPSNLSNYKDRHSNILYVVVNKYSNQYAELTITYPHYILQEAVESWALRSSSTQLPLDCDVPFVPTIYNGYWDGPTSFRDYALESNNPEVEGYIVPNDGYELPNQLDSMSGIDAQYNALTGYVHARCWYKDSYEAPFVATCVYPTPQGDPTPISNVSLYYNGDGAYTATINMPIADQGGQEIPVSVLNCSDTSRTVYADITWNSSTYSSLVLSPIEWEGGINVLGVTLEDPSFTFALLTDGNTFVPYMCDFEGDKQEGQNIQVSLALK